MKFYKYMSLLATPNKMYTAIEKEVDKSVVKVAYLERLGLTS